MSEKPEPKLMFCPYCGSAAGIKQELWVPQCTRCRCTFHLNFGRWIRKAPKKKDTTP